MNTETLFGKNSRSVSLENSPPGRVNPTLPSTLSLYLPGEAPSGTCENQLNRFVL